MKKCRFILLGTLGLALCAQANTDLLGNINLTPGECPGLKEAQDYSEVLCADSVFASMVDDGPLMGTLDPADLPHVWTLYRDAVSLGILPQAGTQRLSQTLYMIQSLSSGDITGYAVVDEYNNAALGGRLEVTSKFNNEQDMQWVSVSLSNHLN